MLRRMKTISVRDLRQRWPEAEARLQVEKEIVITVTPSRSPSSCGSMTARNRESGSIPLLTRGGSEESRAARSRAGSITP